MTDELPIVLSKRALWRRVLSFPVVWVGFWRLGVPLRQAYRLAVVTLRG